MWFTLNPDSKISLHFWAYLKATPWKLPILNPQNFQFYLFVKFEFFWKSRPLFSIFYCLFMFLIHNYLFVHHHPPTLQFFLRKYPTLTDYLPLNNKKSKSLFFYFLKKDLVKKSLTYTSEILSIFQCMISNVFSLQRNFTEYISNCVTSKKKAKTQRKMSHVTVYKTCRIVKKYYVFYISCGLQPPGDVFINHTAHYKRFSVYFVHTKMRHKRIFI